MNDLHRKWVLLYYYDGDDLGWVVLDSYHTRKEARWHTKRMNEMSKYRWEGRFKYKVVKKEDL